MHLSVTIVLLILALVCEVAAAIGFPATRLDLVAAGLAFYFASLLFH